MWRKGNFSTCWWECKLVQSLSRMVWSFLKKLKTELPYNQVTPLLGICPEKNILRKDTSTPVITATLFTVAKTWKQPNCPSTDEQIKKMRYTYTMEYYWGIKRFAAIWTDPEMIILSEVRERQLSYDITCMWNLKNDSTYKWFYYKWTCLQDKKVLENTLKVTKGGRDKLGCN